VVARRDISQEILVGRHKFLVAPGRRAGDFASPGNKSFALRLCSLADSHVRSLVQKPIGIEEIGRRRLSGQDAT
jgi:hypothetical protein